ncbi:MAG TPA: hypothetical protein VGQ53_24910 [Chitinophagaceae bacterium]|jgi:hypothetical protein|nr:hypothetical protein [Chitinophagaceae bacterium]
MKRIMFLIIGLLAGLFVREKIRIRTKKGNDDSVYIKHPSEFELR